MELEQLGERGHPAIDELVQQRQLVRQPRHGHQVPQVARQQGAYPPPQRGRTVRALLQLRHHPETRTEELGFFFLFFSFTDTHKFTD